MRVTEKTLELNIGAEILEYFRYICRWKKTYLQGLTQKQESEKGFDFSANLPPDAQIAAFQFKAPIDIKHSYPFDFRLKREQHEKLLSLANLKEKTVFYVLPFYASYNKIHQDAPCLLRDTWFLPVESMDRTSEIFCYRSREVSTRTIHCCPRRAVINPEFELFQLGELNLREEVGVPVEVFLDWYRSSAPLKEEEKPTDQPRHKHPKHIGGLKLAIIDKRCD